LDAVLEPRLVMPGNEGEPFISGEFHVGTYQRGYRWGVNEVRTLLQDIWDNIQNSKVKKKTEKYYLQPVVVLAREGGSWELVDGQQRLTTLLLIAKYLAVKFYFDDELRYGLSYDTRELSKSFLAAIGTPDFEESYCTENIDFWYMWQAFRTIDEWFSQRESPRKAAMDIYRALTEWVYIIWYQAPPETDAIQLFTRLNRDRIPLTDSELIKALVLSQTGASGGDSSRRAEIAAQWDSFERDLRNDDFWAFLTGSAAKRPTHIDFLFESLTPELEGNRRQLNSYSTFTHIEAMIEELGAEEFWRKVVDRHGLFTGWYHDRELYHRIGYLTATGTSTATLVSLAMSRTHTEFKKELQELITKRLNLTVDKLQELNYDDAAQKCLDVLLLMNVEAVLAAKNSGSRFPFFAYASDGWSLEHINPQNAEVISNENDRREWLSSHFKKINEVWESAESVPLEVSSLIEEITRYLRLPRDKAEPTWFAKLFTAVIDLFAGYQSSDGAEVHNISNLALLQRDFNSSLGNAVFAVKRERIIELDAAGAFIMPCTRNVFLKYYTPASDQQLSIWSPQDRDHYIRNIAKRLAPFLLDSSDLY